MPSVLGVGAFLKNSVCRIEGTEAQLSADLGNLDTAEACRAFEAVVAAMIDGRAPQAVAHDLHPDMHSTRHAATLGRPLFPVQHHHAHAAAIMAEHGIAEPVLALSLDGFGLGPNNEAWGGELLRVDGRGYERLGHLYPLRQPGGDAAARQPWRMGAAALHALGRGDDIATRYAVFPGAALLADMIARGVNSPTTTSAGRLFDAACGLLGVTPMAEFEGQAPMALERMVRTPRVLDGGWRIDNGVLDLRPTLAALIDRAPEDGADLFHGSLIAALADWAAQAAEATGLRHVALGGGCFLNQVLRDGVTAALAARKLTALSTIRLTPGDGALSLGQAWAAALAIEGDR